MQKIYIARLQNITQIIVLFCSGYAEGGDGGGGSYSGSSKRDKFSLHARRSTIKQHAVPSKYRSNHCFFNNFQIIQSFHFKSLQVHTHMQTQVVSKLLLTFTSLKLYFSY